MTEAGSSHVCIVLSPEEGEIPWFGGPDVPFMIGGGRPGKSSHSSSIRSSHVLAAPLHAPVRGRVYLRTRGRDRHPDWG